MGSSMKKQFSTLDQVVKAAIETFPADPEEAARLVEQYLATDERMYRDEIGPIIHTALVDITTHAIHNERRRYFSTPAAGKDGGLAALEAMASARKGLLDYALITSRKLLRDCSADELRFEIKQRRAQAEGTMRIAKWFELIIEFMDRKKGDVVGKCLDEVDLKGLQMKAGIK